MKNRKCAESRNVTGERRVGINCREKQTPVAAAGLCVYDKKKDTGNWELQRRLEKVRWEEWRAVNEEAAII